MIFATAGGIATFVTVILTFVTAVVGMRQIFRKQEKNANAIQEVHILVNSQLTDVVNRVSQLTELLEARGIDVPSPREKD